MTSPTERTVRLKFDASARGLLAASKEGSSALNDFSATAKRTGKALEDAGGRSFKFGGGVEKAASASEALANKIMLVTKLARGPLLASVPLGIAALPAVMRAAAGATALGTAGLVAFAVGGATAKVAVLGVGDALEALADGDPTKIAEAMAKLSPAAQQAAYAIDRARVASQGLRTTVQERFFAQFAGDIDPLVRTYLPQLEYGMGRVSESLGRQVAGFIEWARLPGTVSKVREIMGNISDAIDRTDFTGYLNGFLTFATGGSRGLGSLSDKLTQWGHDFDRWATRVTSDGSVRRWVDDGLAALDSLKTGLQNAKSILDGINTTMEKGRQVSGFLNNVAGSIGAARKEGDNFHGSPFMNWVRGSPTISKILTMQFDNKDAQGKLNAFLGAVNASRGTIQINGNPVPAAGALDAIQAAINSGQGVVTINGQSFPARYALDMLRGAINTTAGNVTINGNSYPATDALLKVQQLVNQGRGTITINGQSFPAQVALDLVRARVNGTSGRMTIEGNNAPAHGATNAARDHANRTRGNIAVGANTGGAHGEIAGLRAEASRPVSMWVTVRKKLIGFAGGGLVGFADGGAVGFANGGTTDPTRRRLRRMPVRARMVPPNTWRVVGDNPRVPEAYIPLNGSRFSDALLHTTANRMGYHLAPMAEGGMLTEVGSWLTDPSSVLRQPAPSAPTMPAPLTNVTVILDGQPIRAVVRTELEADKSVTRRRVGAGAYRGV